MTTTLTTTVADTHPDCEDVPSGTYWLMRAAGVASEVLSEGTLYEAAERLLAQVSASMGFGPQTLTPDNAPADKATMNDDCGAWDQWATAVALLVPEFGETDAVGIVPAPACLDSVTCGHCAEHRN